MLWSEADGKVYKDKNTRVGYYTNKKGLEGIIEGYIIKGSNSIVYLEPAKKGALNMISAEDKYQIKDGKCRTL
ncbi:hypothetical protein N483_13085 [Pseudoalteromonas luteoviolacea NCIMB 1944]|nr:hypothetical protein N483_13085 [Pseudoalteromonas luteoviolacea NCIMB 1944]